MADQTVAESAEKYGDDDSREALQKTSQAIAIMRAVSLAVAAQDDGAVSYEDNRVARWQPAVDAAIVCVRAVSDALINKVGPPANVDWWTPLSILEATGAALWHAAVGADEDTGLESHQLQSIAEAAMDSMGVMYEALAGDFAKGAA